MLHANAKASTPSGQGRGPSLRSIIARHEVVGISRPCPDHPQVAPSPETMGYPNARGRGGVEDRLQIARLLRDGGCIIRCRLRSASTRRGETDLCVCWVSQAFTNRCIDLVAIARGIPFDDQAIQREFRSVALETSRCEKMEVVELLSRRGHRWLRFFRWMTPNQPSP